MTTRTLGGARIHVHEAGRGEPVVLVHSSGMSSRQFKRLTHRLAAGFRVLAPDLLGYGLSEAWTEPGPFDVARDVAVVTEVARAAGGGVHLVGHSYGGFLCLQAAMDASLHVRSIAVYEPVAFGVLRSDEEARARSDLDRLGDELFAPELDGTETWLRRFVEWWNGPGSWDAMPEPARRRFGAAAHKTFHEVNAIRLDETPADAYRAIEAPTLLIHGSETTAAERRVCAILAETLPAVEHRVVEGAGHMGPLTHSETVDAWVEAHLERHAGPDQGN